MDITGSSKVRPMTLERYCRQGEPSNPPQIEEGEKISRMKSRKRRKYWLSYLQVVNRHCFTLEF